MNDTTYDISQEIKEKLKNLVPMEKSYDNRNKEYTDYSYLERFGFSSDYLSGEKGFLEAFGIDENSTVSKEDAAKAFGMNVNDLYPDTIMPLQDAFDKVGSGERMGGLIFDKDQYLSDNPTDTIPPDNFGDTVVDSPTSINQEVMVEKDYYFTPYKINIVEGPNQVYCPYIPLHINDIEQPQNSSDYLYVKGSGPVDTTYTPEDIVPKAAFDRSKIYEAIDKECEYQDNKWGSDKQQSLPGYFLLMRKELEEAETGWAKNIEGKHSALAELVQVVALGVRALEQYGTTGCPASTNDVNYN